MLLRRRPLARQCVKICSWRLPVISGGARAARLLRMPVGERPGKGRPPYLGSPPQAVDQARNWARVAAVTGTGGAPGWRSRPAPGEAEQRVSCPAPLPGGVTQIADSERLVAAAGWQARVQMGQFGVLSVVAAPDV